MIFYIFPYLTILLTPFAERIKLKIYKLIFLLLLVPAFFIATFRGLTGIDTPTYLQIIENVSNEGFSSSHLTEPGFYLLSYLLEFIFQNSSITLSIITSFFCVVFYTAFSKSKLSIFICCSLIIPYFFFDMSMNGIRYGFSFCIAVIALNNRGNKYFLPFLILSLCFHISSILIFIFIEFSKRIKISLFKIILLIIFTLSLLVLNIDYLTNKFDQYLNYSSPTDSSGLSSVIITLLIVIIHAIFIKKDFSLIFLIITSTIFGYIIAKYSYAGLRILNVINFIAMISFLYIDTSKVRNEILFKSSLILTGLICFFFKMRNFLNPGDSEAPFIPYLFIWN